MKVRIDDSFFGPILKYVKDDNVTDINYNGRRLWIDDLKRGRFAVDDEISDSWVQNFANKIANEVDLTFNESTPLLEAETDDLRISIIHGSVSGTGFSISIRKTPAVRRLNDKDMQRSGYADEKVIQLLRAFIHARCSCIVVGDVGSGKTELLKYMTKFIPLNERTITIEDNYEIRISKICPDLDAVEIKVGAHFDYTKAIKASLRQMTTWLMMAESRSKEVAQLLEASSTGCSVITTMHANDVRKIPDRVKNMLGSTEKSVEDNIYNYFDVGILVDIDRSGDSIDRKIGQICVLDHDPVTGRNELTMLYDEGRFLTDELPAGIRNRFEHRHVGNPLKGEPDTREYVDTDSEQRNAPKTLKLAHRSDSGERGIIVPEKAKSPSEAKKEAASIPLGIDDLFDDLFE